MGIPGGKIEDDPVPHFIFPDILDFSQLNRRDVKSPQS